MVGTSEPMRLVSRLSRLVAPRNTPVLITGETGTGKELVARAIHSLSQRSRHRFVVVNCAAIPDTLLEAELFGYTRGAFTGAFQSRPGRIHAAQGGTLLLDEIGELPLSMQTKLLRFLQEGEVQPLGSSDVFRVDVRILASTNADLVRRLQEGRFREDLFYRLMVFPIQLLPLRKRAEDVTPLAQHFLSNFSREAETETKTFSAASRALLERHVWPGNVRELRHAVERAFILSEDESQVRPEHLQFLSSAPCVREVLSAPHPHGIGNASVA
jgi:transcriptional regulator with PAS, ATPase and Fis domain